MLLIKNKSSLTLVELLVVLCVIFVCMGTFAIFAKINLKAARETALRNELNNIRMSIELYKIIKNRLPEDLVSLINQEFTFKTSDGIIIKKQFLRSFRLDKNGNLLDPFMNRYNFDPASGKVFSTTKTYENW
jgi:competence protein ComGC